MSFIWQKIIFIELHIDIFILSLDNGGQLDVLLQIVF